MPTAAAPWWTRDMPLGSLDVLDNNVGIEGPGTVVTTGRRTGDRVMTVNVKSILLTGKYAVPAMAAGGEVPSSTSRRSAHCVRAA